MLVDVVGHQPADDARLVPVGVAVLLEPRLGGVPLVVDLVVVEDHRRRHRREHPADDRVGPDVAVADRVLLEVLEHVDRPVGVDLTALDLLAHVLRRLVGVELVAEHDHRVRPELLGLAQHPQREGVERVDPPPLLVPPALGGVRPVMRSRAAARAEEQLEVLVLGDRPDPRVRELVALGRPHAGFLHADLVLVRHARLEALDRDQCEVVVLDRERLRLRVEHLNLAGLVHLHPDRGFGLTDESEHGADENFRHGVGTYPEQTESTPSRPSKLRRASTRITCGSGGTARPPDGLTLRRVCPASARRMQASPSVTSK